MVPEKYRLPAVGRFLLEQFELRRPGIREWSPEIEAQLRRDAESELQVMEKQLREMGMDDPGYWQRVRRALDEILLPRYGALATGEIELARRDYGIWRGGDLIARATFALAGFLLGIVCVEVPYIPIQAKWFPALLLVLGPLFPDVAMWWYRRRYRKKLEELVRDLAKASETLETYRPLSELTQSLQMRTDLVEAPPVPQRRERS
jgi:cytochrome P450